MIVFLTLIYIAALFLCIKIGLIKLNTFWKLSPVLWMFGLFFVLFVPMQWGAPAGALNNYQAVQEIIPSVSGEVNSVPAMALKRMKKGDVIFTIDPTQFEAKVEELEANVQLSLANLARAQELMTRGVGRQLDIDIYQAEVDSFGSRLRNARWELEHTVVRAPSDGRVVALTLQPGQRVANLPLRSWVAFAEDTKELVVGIPQSRLRFVEPGQSAEIALRIFPGQVFPARVDRIMNVNVAAQLTPSGLLPHVPMMTDPALPYAVVLTLEEEQQGALNIPGGATGTATIYTESMQATHVIRRVMMRMEAWMNYVKP